MSAILFAVGYVYKTGWFLYRIRSGAPSFSNMLYYIHVPSYEPVDLLFQRSKAFHSTTIITSYPKELLSNPHSFWSKVFCDAHLISPDTESQGLSDLSNSSSFTINSSKVGTMAHSSLYYIEHLKHNWMLVNFCLLKELRRTHHRSLSQGGYISLVSYSNFAKSFSLSDP